MKYYIVSNKWTKGMVRTFWSPNSNGYTEDLNGAGLYTEDDVKTMPYPLITKENLKDRCKYETFFISVDDVELLGKKMTCIMN